MNGQKFVYKFVSFPEVAKADAKIPFSVKMGKMENSDEGSSAPDEEDEMPPSPTLSNSPPPSMVASLKPDYNDSEYQRMLFQWQHARSQPESRCYDQANSNNRHSHIPSKNSLTPAQSRHSLPTTDRQRSNRQSPTSSYDAWRTEAEKGHVSNNRTQSPSPKHKDTANYPFNMSSAAMAAAFAFSAATLSDEERTRRLAATAAFWDGFRQAAASINTPEKHEDTIDHPNAGLSLRNNVHLCCLDKNNNNSCCLFSWFKQHREIWLKGANSISKVKQGLKAKSMGVC